MTTETTTKKLLIVDDSKVSRMLIKAHVKAVHPEWEFIEANSGEEAISLIEHVQPDFCTMDINMPGIIGTDAAAYILQKQPNIRMVIFSANIQETFQTRATEVGGVFVAKPVTDKSIALALEHFTGAR